MLLTFNLLSLYQHQTTPRASYRQPGTLRAAVFLCGAVLGVLGRQTVIKLSVAWGGPGKHKPLVTATLDWLNAASPKLVRHWIGRQSEGVWSEATRTHSPENQRPTSSSG